MLTIYDHNVHDGMASDIRSHRGLRHSRHLVCSSSHDGRCRVPDIFHKPHSDPLSYKGRNRKEVAERGVVVMVVVVVLVMEVVVV